MTTSPSVIPPELAAELATRADGESLRQLWQTIPPGLPTVTDTARANAWNALSARLADPARAPFTHDVAPPLTLDTQPPSITPTSARPAILSRRSTQRWIASALAASLALVAWRAVPRTVSVAPGAPAEGFRLDDGSAVWLASGATLKIPRALGWPAPFRSSARQVTLAGRGFFDVTHDGRAFVVRTPDALVRVVGTRFEVRANAAGSQVLVVEGHVVVTADRDGARADVRAGEAARVTPERLTTTRVPTAHIAVWRSGGLAAHDEPLRDVLVELALRYGTTITVAPDVASDGAVSLFYPIAPPLERVLADLCTAQGLRFRQTSRGYVVERGIVPT